MWYPAACAVARYPRYRVNHERPTKVDFLISAGMTYWHWWSLAAILLVLEMLAPGVFFLWLAFAAVLTGIAKLVFGGMIFEIQLLVFALCGLVATFAGRRWVMRRINAKGDDDNAESPGLNQRELQFRGRIITLPHDMTSGETRVVLDGTTWRLYVGQLLKAGDQVRITAIKGTVLQGEAVSH
tara:strand:- start:38440 stop:38988 length:549 start_codon:yes stop_codon:yes gene_type:complete